MFNPQPKIKAIRLYGKALKDLYLAVFERDDYLCTNCGSNQLDRAPHHKQLKSQGGSDTMENLTSLCIPCHKEAHGLIVR